MSQATTTQSRANELIDALARLDQSELFDDLAVGRLSRDARALMKADAAGAQRQERTRCSEASPASKATPQGCTNTTRSRSRCRGERPGHSETTRARWARPEAFKAIIEAHERTPDDLEILGLAISIAVHGGQFRESRGLYERWNALQPNRRKRDKAPMRLAVNAIDGEAFTESAARKVIQVAQQVRLAAKVREAGSAIHSVHGERDRFSFIIHVHASTRQAVDLNTEFADRIVGDEALMTDPGLKFVPMFMGKSVHGSDTRAAP